ncbi:Transcription termination factor 4, mitochondrial [Chionoecetes opilio]|uniref:Transcription termination factor 4, mitochondrial n=1 Tax=Chionoecetes opilio TaxID=41210 RepID=A0A8J5CKW9_CHIOP|nr:Transcription termination factor 4, mitochondrial [Chionoecetes opilio]
MLSTRAVWMRGMAPLLSSSPHLMPFIHGRGKQFCSAANKEPEDPSLVDVEAQVGKLVSDLCLRGIAQYPKRQVTSVYQLLLDLGIKTDTIEAQLLEMPDLLGYSHKAWSSTCEVMVENGLPSLRILQSIALQPRLLRVKPSLLHEKLLRYRQMKIGNMSFLTLAMKYPVLLLSEPSMVLGRVEGLRTFFPPTDLKMMVQNNPSVLTDDWDDINAKIMYIHQEMGLEQPHIAACKCMRRSLLHIKTRHLFLLRAGLYKTPNLYRDKQSYRRNASLSDILDTTDKRFSNRVARMTDMEYEVFKVMMAGEEHGSGDYEAHEADESDEEDAKLSYKRH